jgi:hypothetical protein
MKGSSSRKGVYTRSPVPMVTTVKPIDWSFLRSSMRRPLRSVSTRSDVMASGTHSNTKAGRGQFA